MSKKSFKIGNTTYLTNDDGTQIKRIKNRDFNLNEDFDTGYTNLTIGDSNISETSFVKDGLLQESNKTEGLEDEVKCYISRFRRNSCSWSEPIFFSNEYPDGEVLDVWSSLYSNEKYLTYKIYSTSIPTTLPLDGEFPPKEEAFFIRYQTFFNEWLKGDCVWKYDYPVLDYQNTAGSDQWEVLANTTESCQYIYAKSVPEGCDTEVPDFNDVDALTECGCTVSEDDASSSDSSQSTQDIEESQSSFSSSSSQSSELSSANSSSSEIWLSPKNIQTLYMKMSGEPFVGKQFVLELNQDGSSWSPSGFEAETLTSGTLTLSMNDNGSFILDASLVVAGCQVDIDSAVLSNIKNENMARFPNYLKGFSAIENKYITSDCASSNFECIISHENMKRSNGETKTISQIIEDHELEQMRYDEESNRVQVLIARANKDEAVTGVCRALGYFCLSNSGLGKWEYSLDNESVSLDYQDSGLWVLERSYKVAKNTYNKVRYEISPLDVSKSAIANQYGFFGLPVIAKKDVIKETENANDQCDQVETLILFFSSDVCNRVSGFSPYFGDLTLSLSGGNWTGKSEYNLGFSAITSNLAVWNWSSDSNSKSHEYAVMFSEDGNNWKINIGLFENGMYNNVLVEFVHDKFLSDSFAPKTGIIPKGNISLGGSWANDDMTFVITKS